MNHSHGLNSKSSKLCPVVLFWLGGQRMGARAEEVGGIWAWPGAFPVPSETPGMRAILRHRADWVPVFDLAGVLRTPRPSEESLCLIVKHPDAPFAIQIDATMPMLKMVEPSAIRPVDDQPQPGHSASCVVGGEEWPLYSFCQLIRG